MYYNVLQEVLACPDRPEHTYTVREEMYFRPTKAGGVKQARR
ncbi:hypothetical protein [[Phormidium] sp. ETS-05]|nr:hypothetical protein [[Phormidium] sp. ETS-05]